jgi:metal-responsive CopG/Arc/MetJ family transcriptional regulator
MLLISGSFLEAQVTVRKHPVSIALSNRVLEKIDKEASRQKRSRSEYIEAHLEMIFSEPSGQKID